MEYDIGYIRFYKASKEGNPWLLYIGPPIGGVVILIVIIVILCVLYRRRKRREKAYQAFYQIRMDKMESQYARECKEGITM